MAATLTFRRTALATALVALAGCSSLAPTYERPALAVPAALTDAAPAASAASPAALGFADFTPDARLRALADQALKNNRDLRVAVLNVEQARASLGLARAELYPSLAAGFTASRAPNSQGQQANSFALGLNLSSYEADLFGRVRSLSDAAAARLLASDEGRRAAQVSLLAGVAAADLSLRADAELLALTQRTLATREDTLRLARIRFEGGAAAEGELRSAESLVASARASLAALQRQRSQDANALALLLGGPVPAGLPTATPLAQVAFAELPAGLSSDVLLERPDVRQAEQALIAANANIGAARAAFFPRILLTGQAGFASTQLSNLFQNTVWTFTGQLLQPIFDAGRNQANLDAANVGRDIAVAQYEKAVQSAFREVADALAGRATLGEQLAAQQAQAEAEGRRAELAERLFQGGAASALDRLDAERSALAARQAVVQVQLARLQNAVALYRALGGGAGPSAR